MKKDATLLKSFIARKFLHDPITMLFFPKVNQYPIQAVDMKQNNNCLRSNMAFRFYYHTGSIYCTCPKMHTPKSFPISLYIHMHTLSGQHLKFYVLRLFYWVDKIAVVFNCLYFFVGFRIMSTDIWIGILNRQSLNQCDLPLNLLI